MHPHVVRDFAEFLCMLAFAGGVLCLILLGAWLV